MSDGDSTWLPNLVNGLSIWKLARDLNEPQFMDGRLLEPEVEGSDSLPAAVHWPTADLIPLAEARHLHPAETEAAMQDFLVAIDRVQKTMGDANSGYAKYREAFSIPSPDVDHGGHYFFNREERKLFVINWGASPRKIARRRETVFDYASFDALLAQRGYEGAPDGSSSPTPTPGEGEAPPMLDASSAPGPEPAHPSAEGDDEPPDHDDEQPQRGSGRPLWLGLILLLGAAALIAILLQRCGGDAAETPDDATAAGRGGNEGASAGEGRPDPSSGQGGAATGQGAGGGAAQGQGGRTEAGEGVGGGPEGSGGESGAGESNGEGEEGGSGSGEGEAEGAPVVVDGTSVSPVIVPGEGYIIVDGSPRPSADSGIPFRAHSHPRASAWRIKKGSQHLHPTLRPALRKQNFEVFLKPGRRFDQIEVEWRDGTGRWHPH
ncbi:MAG: hypothetical protein AAGA56_26995 [Myxococcota bacterium]